MNPSSTQAPSSIWKSLLNHTLLGVGQHPISANLLKDLADLNIDIDDEKHALLEGIGIVQLLEKGAREWINGKKIVALETDFKNEKTCSALSMQHLQVILDGHYNSAFAEFTQLLAQSGLSLPPTSLPRLLDQCVQSKDLWQLIKPIIGKRGFWLLRQHPSWKTLIPKELDFLNWFEEKDSDQIAAFIAFRLHSPTSARDSLLIHWSNLDYKNKARLLSTFSDGLSIEDEGFLESCLNEKRKEVRTVAAEYLARLEGSQLIMRLFKEATSCLSIKKNGLQINLPEELPETTKKDGIWPTGSKVPGGLKLNWLHQLLSRIPFTFWEKEWQLDAHKIVHLFAQSGYPSLVDGITESLLRFPNSNAIEAQISLWMKSENSNFWKSSSAIDLLNQSSVEFFNQSIIKWLEAHGPFLASDSLPAIWLNNSRHPWQPQLSKIVLLGFQDMIQNRSLQDWNMYHYKNLIHIAAYQSSPVLLEYFKKKWYLQSSTFGRWATEVEKFLQILSFRIEMTGELSRSVK